MSIVKNVQTHWEEQELLGIDCLQRADDSVIILNCYSVKQEEEYVFYSFPLCETTVQSLEKYNDDLWTEVQVLTQKHHISSENFIVGGEGGMGNEGFIACLDRNNKLHWALFFTDSNPFYEIEIENNLINAFTSKNRKYQINTKNPELVNITYYEWK